MSIDALYWSILNEVLSLNAQEYVMWNYATRLAIAVLNEVLSLNAQESRYGLYRSPTTSFLNEVLSLNAQEYGFLVFEPVEVHVSSMKS